MYRIGYIDDDPRQYPNYASKIKRRDAEMELILLEDCKTKQDYVNKIYEEQIDVLLIDYKMAGTYGFNGTTLVNYINDQIRDLECFILTAVDTEQISDGLVAGRNRYSKTIFDTEAGDLGKEKKLKDFLNIIKESADVFRTRREQKIQEYRNLLDKKKGGTLGVEEEEFVRLYQVLSSYGMVEKLPESMMKSDFEQRLNKLLGVGNAIIEKYEKEKDK